VARQQVTTGSIHDEPKSSGNEPPIEEKDQTALTVALRRGSGKQVRVVARLHIREEAKHELKL
jgi:hypothetical protein